MAYLLTSGTVAGRETAATSVEVRTMAVEPGSDLACAEPTVMAWEDGERERWWSRAAALDHGLERPGWDDVVARANPVDLTPPQLCWLFAKGPEAAARAMLGRPLMPHHRQRADLGRVAVARFEVDAWAFARSEAGELPDRLGLLVLPFRGAEPAALVAGWLRRLGSGRLWARLWLGRHAECAVRALVPAAAGRPGRPRRQAEEALRYLAGLGHGPASETAVQWRTNTSCA